MSEIVVWNSDGTQSYLITAADIVQEYSEVNLDALLSPLNTLSTYAGGTPVHVYLANSSAAWGDFANTVFLCLSVPSKGYLKNSWPGNQALWLATILLDSRGDLVASYIPPASSLYQANVTIDDGAVRTDATWSSTKIKAELDARLLALLPQVLYNNELLVGLPGLVLEYLDTSHVRLRPMIGQEVLVVFPDMTQRSIPVSGITISVQGDPGVLYYVYLGSETCRISADAPATTTEPLNLLVNEILVGFMGMSATDMISGSWNVYSCWNEGEKTWSVDRSYENLPIYENDTHVVTTDIDLPGLVVPPGKTARAKVNGITRLWYWKTSAPTEQGEIVRETINGTGIYLGTGILHSMGSVNGYINPVSLRYEIGEGVYYDTVQDYVSIYIIDADLRAGLYSLGGQLSVVRSN